MSVLSVRIRRVCLMLAALPLAMGTAFAQEGEADDGPIEEIVTVGSQIRGAQISDALAVSVVTAEDIEALGIDSGDELLDFMSEQGQNFFNESENISGGVNAARGDIGAYNLRNLGTGNTLVLLNGRRMVNAAAYQTEEVGGSFIPVNTVNSQSMPVAGLERVEVLRDGASAIYGADAVAGVVNYVVKTDFEGFTIRAKYADYEGLPRNDETLTLEWGKDFNGGRTNFSVFANYYHRDRVSAQDDKKWADSDFRRLVPENSPWFGNTSFRNTSVNSEYPQLDIRRGGSFGLEALGITDSRGEFHLYEVGDVQCDWDLNADVCGADDQGAQIHRYNNNEQRDIFSDLDRLNVFAFLNHEFDSGLESFTEMTAYMSETVTVRHGSSRLSAVEKYEIPADNYYNPFGPCGSDSRLPDSVIGTGVPCEGLTLQIDNHRWVVPRIVDNDGEVFRILQGFRGQAGDWDWEAAASYSRATKEDITHNRVSNTLMTQGLALTTPDAINLFGGRDNTNIEQALVDVRRDNETELTTVDFKMSNPDLFELPAGPVAMLVGVEYREESFVDDRDPRLDGQIQYTDNDDNTFPLVSDVVNSSPTLDSSGSRDVVSIFAEFQIPVFDSLDVQAALRYEDFSDVGNTTVGKFAFGWRPIEPLLFRGSWSEAFRVPNLVTVNESGVARSNVTNDFVHQYVDPDDTLDGELSWSYGVQRTAGGSDDLIPEQSTNISFGAVLDVSEYLTFTIDYWNIEKEDTIGLFGEDNHLALDLLLMIEAGNGNCGANPRVVRDTAADLSQEALDLYSAAGLCPVGDAQRVDDAYANLDTRDVSGHDIGVYFDFETRAGDFNIRYVASFTDKYEQLPGPAAQALFDAQDAGILPPTVNIEGFGNLIRHDTIPRNKQTARVSWRKGGWGAAVTGNYISDVIQDSLTLSDGTKFIIPSMQTYNAYVDYRFDTFADSNARLRFGALNIMNERAPLADDSFGYSGDIHRDMPRSYYVDLKLTF
jgi:iron complex outermembrane receptor protein